jgi:hypothetical protein
MIITETHSLPAVPDLWQLWIARQQAIEKG